MLKKCYLHCFVFIASKQALMIVFCTLTLHVLIMPLFLFLVLKLSKAMYKLETEIHGLLGPIVRKQVAYLSGQAA